MCLSRGEDGTGAVPRSKKQLTDMAASIGPLNENVVGDILAFNEERQDEVIWHHQDLPSDLWVFGTKNMASEIEQSAQRHPIVVDVTFNFGKFEVTPFTYRHPNIEARSKNISGLWTPALILGPTVIQENKEEETYERGFEVISKKTKLCNEKVDIITDGEDALINSAKKAFRKGRQNRCTRHFKGNCEEKLSKGLSIPSTVSNTMLDIMFRKDGLIDKENNKSFKTN